MKCLFFILALITLSELYSPATINAQTNLANPKADIHKLDTIVWFGSDFSLFRLINPKKVGQEVKLKKYLNAWNEYYKASISNVKIASWVKASKVINDKEFTDNSYNEILPSNWITGQQYSFSKEEIANHILKYKSNNKGIGLTYIIESFNKTAPSKVNGYFVWFDISTKQIIKIFKVEGVPSSTHMTGPQLTIRTKGMPKQTGMTGYWLNGMIKCTVNFSIAFDNEDPYKKEKQY